MNDLTKQANDAIRAYHDLDDARDRLAEEVRQIDARVQPQLMGILKGSEGTLDQARALFKEATDAHGRLSELDRKRARAHDAAQEAHTKATRELLTGSGLLEVMNKRKYYQGQGGVNEDKQMVGQRPTETSCDAFMESLAGGSDEPYMKTFSPNNEP